MGQGQSKCVDFSKIEELEKKIQELHNNALTKIDKLNKKYVGGEGPCINNEGLKLFLHQIKNKMLLVAVVGEGSCGKSTLINAFLRDRILPSGIGKVTGCRIFIGHDPNVHKDPCESSNGHCDECPYLVQGIGTNNRLCHGLKNIKSKIKEMNKKDEKQKDPLVLYTYIPVFHSKNESSTPYCTPYLVDSPGVEVINDDVKSYYSILSAMIYVENYQRLLQNEENIRKELGCKPESASLFFAVSHFDKYYTSYADEEKLNEEETKTEVESSMKLVKREEVFPVCGSWALHAHLALRLKCSINGTKFQDWNIKMCEQCQALLKGPIQAGEAALKTIQTKIADWDVFRTHDLPEKLKKKLTDETKRCLEELKPQLQKKYGELINYILGHDPESESTNFVEEVEAQVVHLSPIGEPSEDIKDYISLKTEEKKNAVASSRASLGNKLLRVAKGLAVFALVVTAAPIVVGGAVAGGAVATGAVTAGAGAIATGVAATGGIAGGGVVAAGAGLVAGAGYVMKKIAKTITVPNVKMSIEDVNALCDKINIEITSSDEIQKAVKNVLRDYSNTLKAKYDQEWGSKWESELNQKLKEAEDSLKDLQKEEEVLKQALKELKECNESLKVSIRDLSSPTPEDDRD
uniref:Dynamin N-terminal domain-containing protein n=1 Tax=Amphimedon queenslandica TaxID=400682 RepID=A0A1X7U473_AMPQE